MPLHTLKINYNVVETQLLYTHVIHFIVIFTLRGLEPSAYTTLFPFSPCCWLHETDFTTQLRNYNLPVEKHQVRE